MAEQTGFEHDATAADETGSMDGSSQMRGAGEQLGTQSGQPRERANGNRAAAEFG